MAKDNEKITFKVGDEIWWFQINQKDHGLSYGFHKALLPGELDLIHDQIREIDKDGILICWHCAKKTHEVWGKTRQEAWDKLKDFLSKWGELE